MRDRTITKMTKPTTVRLRNKNEERLNEMVEGMEKKRVDIFNEAIELMYKKFLKENK